jgi:putative nucleotidyltransferase with HDIG domain
LRVGQLASRLGRHLNLTSVEIQHLEIGGYLHDVGKIGIRDSILLKPDVLTSDERHCIEEHPVIGLRIIDPIELPDSVRQFVAEHHEKIDGSGYPNGLKAPELSIFARIGAVSDMYDALITDRPYRAAFTLDEVLNLLTREAQQGRLDARVVDALTRIAEAWEIERREDESLTRFADLYREPAGSVA